MHHKKPIKRKNEHFFDEASILKDKLFLGSTLLT